jgi:uncharacterized membrane protein SirB2
MNAVVEFANWLGFTPLSIGIQSLAWLTPLLQAIHILMIGIVFVSMLMIVLRVLDRAWQNEAFDAVWARFAPWMWNGLMVMAATGLVLIVGEPVRELTATSFWLKLALIAIGVAGVVWLHRTLAGHVAPEFPRSTRVVAVAVIIVWVAIIFLGRAIAYDVEVWGSWT